MIEDYASFTLDKGILFSALEKVLVAKREERGIFKGGINHFLPQWNLPAELEYDPQQREVRDPKEAALWLWTRAFCDRRIDSGILMEKAKAAWENEEQRWIFHPEEVVQKYPGVVGKALKDYFGVQLPVSPRMSSGSGYWKNCKRLLKRYDGDPRNMIQGLTAQESRDVMGGFEGIKTIANLVVQEFYDRRIASPLDPENTLFKIDVHKGRFATNVGAIEPKPKIEKDGQGNKREIERRYVHHWAITDALEHAYKEFCDERGIDNGEKAEMDAAIWVVGSEICTRKNHAACETYCPLYMDDTCKGLTLFHNGKKYLGVREHEGKGSILIYEKDGSRKDIRRGQQGFFKEFGV